MKALSALALMGLLSQCNPPPAARVAPLPAPRGHLKVLTFNVNFAGVNMERSVQAILASGADVVALQETTLRWEHYLRVRLALAYPHQRYRRWGGAGGQAFLSKRPLRHEGYTHPPRGGWFPGWRVSVGFGGKRVHLVNVHLRPPIGRGGNTSTVASAYFYTRSIRQREIQTHLRGVPAKGPVIVLGDFNESEGGRALTWLQRRGFRSALAAHDRRTATWQWRTSFGTVRSRLDHLLYRGLRCTGAQVRPYAASDHFPVVAVFANP